MIFDIKNTSHKSVVLYDSKGTPIRFCYEYDTDTRKAKLYLCNDKGNFLVNGYNTPTAEVAKIEVELPGSYIVVDGKRY